MAAAAGTPRACVLRWPRASAGTSALQLAPLAQGLAQPGTAAAVVAPRPTQMPCRRSGDRTAPLPAPPPSGGPATPPRVLRPGPSHSRKSQWHVHGGCGARRPRRLVRGSPEGHQPAGGVVARAQAGRPPSRPCGGRGAGTSAPPLTPSACRPPSTAVPRKTSRARVVRPRGGRPAAPPPRPSRWERSRRVWGGAPCAGGAGGCGPPLSTPFEGGCRRPLGVAASRVPAPAPSHDSATPVGAPRGDPPASPTGTVPRVRRRGGSWGKPRWSAAFSRWARPAAYVSLPKRRVGGAARGARATRPTTGSGGTRRRVGARGTHPACPRARRTLRVRLPTGGRHALGGRQAGWARGGRLLAAVRPRGQPPGTLTFGRAVRRVNF